MIPKVIHYCWFGNNPLPKSAVKCIKSWEKYFPDYEIKEWNEKNYDIHKIPYISQAYDAKKYAFVSDYARFDILYQNGGLYFDTDVEIIKSYEDILCSGQFMGCEIDGECNNPCMVNPGLGLGIEAGNPIILDIIEQYKSLSFLRPDGSFNTKTVVKYTTEILKTYGLESVNNKEKIGEITIYSKDYFNPLNSNTGVLQKTENTHSIHWYDNTWHSKKSRFIKRASQPIRRIMGENFFVIIKEKITGEVQSY